MVYPILTEKQSDFYKVYHTMVNGRRLATMFMVTDESAHKIAKRPVDHAYAMSTVLEYESSIDTTSTVFLEQLTPFFCEPKKICDLGQWLQWYAFDVIGEITFGQRLGFLEQARDVRGLIAHLHQLGRYSAVVGQMPWLDYVLEKNPIVLKLGPQFLGHAKTEVASFVMEFLEDRVPLDENPSLYDEVEIAKATTKRKDLLSKFVSAARTYQQKVPASQLLSWSLSNINAGSDTTAIALRTIFCKFFLKLLPMMTDDLWTICCEILVATGNCKRSSPTPISPHFHSG
jgi:cytochrome P450